MKVEQRPIGTIKPYEANPRINDPAVDAVAKSIEEFGFRQPIVVDQEGVIVVGHTRWKAAAKLGLAEVPVHVARDLTPEQRKAYRIADNKTADFATWDIERLVLRCRSIDECATAVSAVFLRTAGASTAHRAVAHDQTKGALIKSGASEH